MSTRLSRPILCVVVAATVAIACGTGAAQPPVTFEGKTISMLINSSAGGGTDLTGRLLAPFLTKYLPGNPAVVVRNVPGAERHGRVELFRAAGGPGWFDA